MIWSITPLRMNHLSQPSILIPLLLFLFSVVHVLRHGNAPRLSKSQNRIGNYYHHSNIILDTSSVVNQRSPPKFEGQVLEGGLSDGYWASFVYTSSHRLPDVVAFGVREGIVNIYRNPYVAQDVQNINNYQWQRENIDTIPRPVAVSSMSGITGAYDDIAIATHFGQFDDDFTEHGGHIYLYHNPKNSNHTDHRTLKSKTWSKEYIGRVARTHRVYFGHFTSLDEVQLLAVPVSGSHGNSYAPVSITLFTRRGANNNMGWGSEIIDNVSYHQIHDAEIGKFAHLTSTGDVSKLDSFVLASMEGLTWLYFNGETWQSSYIGTCAPKPKDLKVGMYWGCENVAVGKKGDDHFAYVIGAGPFHGNIVRVFHKIDGVKNSLRAAAWLDSYVHAFDVPDVVRDGSGPVHQLATASFDGDGDDEVLVADKKSGTFSLRVENIDKKIMQLSKITNAPATRLDIADIDGDDSMDFVSFGDAVNTTIGFFPATLNIYRNIQACR